MADHDDLRTSRRRGFGDQLTIGHFHRYVSGDNRHDVHSVVGCVGEALALDKVVDLETGCGCHLVLVRVGRVSVDRCHSLFTLEAKVCEEETLKDVLQVLLGQIGVETAARVKVGDDTLLALTAVVDGIAGDGRDLSAEIRIAVGFELIPLRSSREHAKGLLLSIAQTSGI